MSEQSQRPSSVSFGPAPKRPAYFVLALTMVSLIGLFGWWEGCQTIHTLYDPNRMKAAAEHISDAQMAHWQQVLIDALVAQRAHTWPLAVGQFLLGMLLWICTMGLLFGRSQVRGLLLQSMGVYAAFLCVSYVLRAPLRAVQLDGLLASDIPSVDGQSREQTTALFRTLAVWTARSALAFQLSVLATGLFALTRPRVRAWLEAYRGRRDDEQDR